MVLVDEHRYPFSLFSEVKKGNSSARVEKAGGVEETMDRTIGRPVILLKGTVSANNYIDYQELQLTGDYIYIQFSLLKLNVATIHLEIMTNDDLPFRISCSTLHKEPRFLARQLRLPIPTVDIKPGSYLLMELHMNAILAKFCPSPAVGKPLSMKYLKRVQLCSSMQVRDVVTCQEPLGIAYKTYPKELQLKPLAEANMYFYDVLNNNSVISPSPAKGRPGSPSRQSSNNTGGVRLTDLVLVYSKVGKGSAPSGSAAASSPYNSVAGISGTGGVSLNNSQSSLQQSQPTASIIGTSTNASPETVSSTYVSAGLADTDTELNSIVFSGDINNDIDAKGDSGGDSGLTASNYTEVSSTSSQFQLQSRFRKEKTYKLPSQQASVSANALALVQAQQSVSAQLLPTLDRSVGYDGISTILLLYSGHLAVYPSGSVLVLVDLTGVTSTSRGFENHHTGGNVGNAGSSQLKGLWKLFPLDREKPWMHNHDEQEEEEEGGDIDGENGGTGIQIDKDTGYKQAYLYGHSAPVTLLDVSYAANVLLSAEGGVPNGQIIVWDLNDANTGADANINTAVSVSVTASPGGGASAATPPVSGIKLACFRPHHGNLVCFSVSSDGSMLVTVGFDQFHRYQIIVWDLQVLIQERVGLNSGAVAYHSSARPSGAPPSPHASVRVKTGAGMNVGAGAGAGAGASTSHTKTTSVSLVTGGLDLVPGLIIAKQISDFPITKIKFSPFESYALVSCGRENIRFWRIRKGHLPGRPVALNQFSRKGFSFADLECVSCPAYNGGPIGGDKDATSSGSGGSGGIDGVKEDYDDDRMDLSKDKDRSKASTKYGARKQTNTRRSTSASGFGSSRLDVMKSTVFVISDKGLLFRIDYESEKIVASYHLHTGAITSMAVLHSSATNVYGQTVPGATAGSTSQSFTSASANAASASPSCYIVTGGSDKMMRVWPVDFTDYILESQHEGSVNSLQTMTVTTTTPTNVNGYEGTTRYGYDDADEESRITSSNTRINASNFSSSYQILVGTSAVTIGLLDMSMHSYHTVVRSHDGPVHFVGSNSIYPTESTCKALHGEEFVTLGSSDHTIRLFDTVSTQQKYEFTAPVDVATVAVFHPKDHLLVCGFESGYVRVFEIENTLTLYEKHKHIGAVSSLLFASTGDKLYSAGVDGQVYMYEVELGYDSKHVLGVSGLPMSMSAQNHVHVMSTGTTISGTGTVTTPNSHSASPGVGGTPNKAGSTIAVAHSAVYLSLSSDGLLLAACSNTGLKTLVVVDTIDYMPRFKLNTLQTVKTTTRFDTSMRPSMGVFPVASPVSPSISTGSHLNHHSTSASNTSSPATAASSSHTSGPVSGGSSVSKSENSLLNSAVHGLVFVTDVTYHADNHTIYFDSIPSTSTALYVATDKSIVGFVVDCSAVDRICKAYTYGVVADTSASASAAAEDSMSTTAGDNDEGENAKPNPCARRGNDAPDVTAAAFSVSTTHEVMRWEDRLIKKLIHSAVPGRAAKAYLLHPQMRIKSMSHDPNYPNILTFTCRASSDETNITSGGVVTKYRNYSGSSLTGGSSPSNANSNNGAVVGAIGGMTPKELNSTQYADSFFMLAFKLKVLHNTATDTLQNKLFISQPVVQTVPTGGYITSVVSCFSESKILCTDSYGVITVWHWEQVHMDELLVCVDFPPVPPAPVPAALLTAGQGLGQGQGQGRTLEDMFALTASSSAVSDGVGFAGVDATDSATMTTTAVNDSDNDHCNNNNNDDGDSDSDVEDDDEYCTAEMIHGGHGDTHAAAVHLGTGTPDQRTYMNTAMNSRHYVSAAATDSGRSHLTMSDFRSKSIDNHQTSNHPHSMHVNFVLGDGSTSGNRNSSGLLPQHLRPSGLSVSDEVNEPPKDPAVSVSAADISESASPCDYSAALFSPTIYDASGNPDPAAADPARCAATSAQIKARQSLAEKQAQLQAQREASINAPTPRTKIRMQNTLQKSSTWFSGSATSISSPRQPRMTSSLHRRPSMPTISNTGNTINNSRSPRTPRSGLSTPQANQSMSKSPRTTTAMAVTVTPTAEPVTSSTVDFSSLYASGGSVHAETEPQSQSQSQVEEETPEAYIIGGADTPDAVSETEGSDIDNIDDEYDNSSDSDDENPYLFKPPIPSEVSISQELSWRCQHISHRISVRPSYCAKLQEFLSCDGASVIVRQLSRRLEGPIERPGGEGCGSSYVSSPTTSVLTKPHDFTAVGAAHWQGVITSVDHSYFGDYISVVVLKDAGGDVVNSATNNTMCELLLWRLASATDISTANTVDVADHSSACVAMSQRVSTACGADFAELHQRVYFTSVYLPTSTLITTWTRLYPDAAYHVYGVSTTDDAGPSSGVNNDLNDDLLLMCLPGSNAQEISISLVSMNTLLLAQQSASGDEGDDITDGFAAGGGGGGGAGQVEDYGASTGFGTYDQGLSMSSLIMESSVPVVLFPMGMQATESHSTVKVHRDSTILGMKTIPSWARGSTTTFAGKTDDIGVLLWSSTKIWVVNLTAITKAKPDSPTNGPALRQGQQFGSSALCAVLSWTLDLQTNCKVKSIDICNYLDHTENHRPHSHTAAAAGGMGGGAYNVAVILDTYDNLCIVTISHGLDGTANVVRSTTVSISGAHASGSPRSVICTTKNHSPYLIVNYAKSFTVFKLNLSTDGPSVFASLKYIQKVCLAYSPEYLTILPVPTVAPTPVSTHVDDGSSVIQSTAAVKKPHERSNSINDILASNSDGELSLVSFFSSQPSQGHPHTVSSGGSSALLEVAQHTVSTVVSALPSKPPAEMLVHSEHAHPAAGFSQPLVVGGGRDSNLLSMLDRKGHIHLYHSKYGVRLPAPGDGDPIGLQTVQTITTYHSNSAGNGNGYGISAATRTPSYLAAGLKSGRILIYNSATMVLVKALPVPVKFAVKPHTYIEAQQWIDDLLYHSFTPHTGGSGDSGSGTNEISSKTKPFMRGKSINTTGSGKLSPNTNGLNYKSHNRKYYEGLIDSQNKLGMVKHLQIISSPMNIDGVGSNDPMNESSSSSSSTGTTNNGSVLALVVVYEDNTMMIYDISNVSCATSNDNNVLIWRSDANAKPFLPDLGGSKTEIMQLTEESFSIAKINASRNGNCITGLLKCHDVSEGGISSAMFGVFRNVSGDTSTVGNVGVGRNVSEGRQQQQQQQVVDLIEVRRVPIALSTANLQFGAAAKFTVSLLNSDIRFTANELSSDHAQRQQQLREKGLTEGVLSTPDHTTSATDTTETTATNDVLYAPICPSHHHLVRYSADVVAMYMLCELSPLSLPFKTGDTVTPYRSGSFSPAAGGAGTGRRSPSAAVVGSGSPSIVVVSDGFGENENTLVSEQWIMCSLFSPTAATAATTAGTSTSTAVSGGTVSNISTMPYYTEKLLNVSENAATAVIDVSWDYLCGSVLTSSEQLILLDLRRTVDYVASCMSTNTVLAAAHDLTSAALVPHRKSIDADSDSDSDSDMTPFQKAVETLYIDLNYSFGSVNTCDWAMSRLFCQQICYDQCAADEEVTNMLNNCQENEIEAFVVKEEQHYAARPLDVVLDGGTVIKEPYTPLEFIPKSYSVRNNNLCMQVCVYRYNHTTLLKFDIEDKKTYKCAAIPQIGCGRGK